MTDSAKPKKKRPPFNEDVVLRGAWRRIFKQSDIYREVLNAATRRVARFNKDGARAAVDSKEALCNVCKNWVKFSVGGKNNVEVDHIVPVIDVDDISGKVKDWNVYKRRLFCDKSNLQVICDPCHDIKTAKERLERQALKDKEALDKIEEQIKCVRTVADEKALKKEIAKFLKKTKTQETQERAAKLKELIINRLTKED